MKHRVKRRVISLLLALVMITGLLPYTALAALSQAGYEYLDENGDRKIAAGSVMTSSDINLENSVWYCVTTDITMSERIVISGNVNIILSDNTTLTANEGIQVEQGSSLTIWANSTDVDTMGKLIATVTTQSNNNNNAAIGSNCNNGNTAGDITINGGYIEATGKWNGAAIGGGKYRGFGTITINGGYVEATSSAAAAIGSGFGAPDDGANTIDIKGGTVIAKGGGEQGAAIGNALNCSGKVTINISGGYVDATAAATTSDFYGAIGGGGEVEINISGGNVNATTNNGAAAIGSRSGTATINITGGTVTATTNSYGPAIGGGEDKSKSNITISGATVTAVSTTGAPAIAGKVNNTYIGQVDTNGYYGGTNITIKGDTNGSSSIITVKNTGTGPAIGGDGTTITCNSASEYEYYAVLYASAAEKSYDDVISAVTTDTKNLMIFRNGKYENSNSDDIKNIKLYVDVDVPEGGEISASNCTIAVMKDHILYVPNSATTDFFEGDTGGEGLILLDSNDVEKTEKYFTFDNDKNNVKCLVKVTGGEFSASDITPHNGKSYAAENTSVDLESSSKLDSTSSYKYYYNINGTVTGSTNPTHTFTMGQCAAIVNISTGHAHTLGTDTVETVFQPWEKTNSLPTTPGSYVLTDNVTISGTWNVPEGEFYIDLNGYNITCSNGTAIALSTDSTLTLYDCKSGTGTDGIIKSTSGKGVEIRGGTFNMYGGSITENSSSGVHVGAQGTFNMYGGSITENSSHGVYVVSGGSFNVGGKVTITGNEYEYMTNRFTGNVFLLQGAKIGIIGDLSGSSIGVTMSSAGTFTEGWNEKHGNAETSVFTSDDGSYVVRQLIGQTELSLHSHSYQYALAEDSTDTITETCDSCDHEATVEISVNDTVSLYYTGGEIKAAKITKTGGFAGNITDDDIVYENNKAVGTATAKITINNVEACVTYSITKQDIATTMPTVSMDDYTYGGTVSTPSLSGEYEGKGTTGVTYYYNSTNSNSGGTEFKDITGTTLDAGTYYMYAVIDETTFYKGYTTATKEFKVENATQSAPVIDNTDVVAIDYLRETITFDSTNYEVWTNPSESGTAIASGASIIPGTLLYIRTKAAKNYNASDWVQITVAARPSAPTGVTATVVSSSGRTDGKISGVDSNMEYKLKDTDVWTAISTTEISGLSAGTYEVRYKAVAGTSFTSESVSIEIEVGHAHTLGDANVETVFQPWKSENSLPTAPGKYYLTGNVTISATWEVPEGEFYIDLNGYNITCSNGTAIALSTNRTLTLYDCKGGTGTDGEIKSTNSGHSVEISGGTFNMYGGSITENSNSGVYVKENGTFNMYGGSITENLGCGVYVNENSTFNMYGGSITENSSFGVYVKENGTFNMYGGSITENRSSGVFVKANGTFNMYGGSITENSSHGVYVVSGGSFNVGGKVTITGNELQDMGNRVPSNVFLFQGAKIGIIGDLSGSQIGVRMDPSAGTFTEGWDTYHGEAETTVFTSDDGSYVVKQLIGQTELSLHSHSSWSDWSVDTATCTEGGSQSRTCNDCGEVETKNTNAKGHDYKYALAEGSTDTIKETCSRCNHEATVTIYVDRNVLTYYTNSAIEAAKTTTTGGFAGNITDEDITYENNRAVGTATAKITINDVTAYVTYEIIKRDIATTKPTVSMTGYTYNGTVSTPSLSGSYDGGGTVTYYYNSTNSNSGGTVFKDITGTTLDAGTYYMYAVIAETDFYYGYKTATKEFKVENATQSTPVISDPSVVEINYVNETITFDSTNYEVWTNPSESGTAIASGALIIPGTLLYIRTKEAENYNASDWVQITVAARPAAPEGLTVTDETSKDQHNGKISGVNSNMEYKLQSDDEWTEITDAETQIIGLAPGTYEVRYKAVAGTSFASATTSEEIEEGPTLIVSLDSNGGSRVDNIVNLSYNDSVGDLPTTTRTGYDFYGWYKDAEQLTPETKITTNVTYTARWFAHTFTVAFDANGGTGTMEGMLFTYDSSQNLTANSFTRQGYYFAGWALSADGTIAYGDGQSVKNLTATNMDTVTLYAIWNRNPTYSVSGTVTNGSGAGIKLVKGNETAASTTCDEDGKFTLSGIEAGTYNLIATSSDGQRTVTRLVTLTTENQEGLALTLPTQTVNSVLEVKENTPNVVVGSLDQEADAVKEKYAGASSVTVTMTVESVDEITETPTVGSEQETLKVAQDEIKKEASNKTLEYIEISIVENVDEKVSEIHQTNSLMEIVIPFEKGDKQNITVYRYHGGVAEELTTTENSDGEYIVVASDSITVYANKFSTYAVGYTIPVYVKGYVVTNNIGDIVTSSNTVAAKGSTVTLTAIENSGFDINEIIVTDANGNSVEVTKVSDTVYTFIMPDSSVSINATFQTVDPDADCPSKAYSDVDTTLWYHDYIDYVINKGLLRGYGDGKFGPLNDLTRGQLMVILARLSGESVNTISEGVAWAVENEISDGTNPDKAITREQLATMLWRFAGSPTVEGEISYTDSDQVSSWAAEAVKWASSQGILGGYPDGTLRPLGTATRAHASKMFMMLIGY